MVPLMSVPLCTVSSLYLIREADIIGCIDVYSDKADPPRPIKMCTPNFPTEMAIFYANSLSLVFFISTAAPSKELTVKIMPSQHRLCHKRGVEILSGVNFRCMCAY